MVDCSAQTIAVPPSALLDALSKAFAYPSGGIAATTAALRALDAQAFPAFEGAIREAIARSGQFDSQTAEQLAYTRLFIGSLRMEAPPYASYYLEEENTLNGRAAAEVEEVYGQFGIRLGPSEIAPPDHLRYLLAFLALLAARYEETGEAAFAEAYADFRDAYLLTWIDECRRLVDSNAEEPYYPALMALVVAVLKCGEPQGASPKGSGVSTCWK